MSTLMRQTSMLVIGFTFSVGCSPDSDEAKQARRAAELDLNTDALNRARKACKAIELKAEIDWGSFEGNYAGTYNQAYVGKTCAKVVSSLARYCRQNAAGRQEVAKEIKGVRCFWDEDATEKELERAGASQDIDDDYMVAGFNWDTKNVGREPADFLNEELGIETPDVDEVDSGRARCLKLEGRAKLACINELDGTANPCYAACGRSCRGASNRSKCVNACRRACRGQ